MKIAEAYVEIRAKGDKAKTEAKNIAKDIGRIKPDEIKIDADAKPARDELNKLETTSKAKGRSIAKNLVGLFSAGIFVSEVGKAIGAASDLEQAVGGTKAVFQDSSGVIDQWAQDSAKNFGLSERAFRESTAQIGAQLKGYGLSVDEAAQKSVDLTRLGGDLAATFGGPVSEAVGALGATLRGEFDPAERYGLALSAVKVEAEAARLGLLGLDGKMTSSAKVQATLSLITQQTADAQGQFARESGSAAGQAQIAQARLEDMRAEIGSNLLPVVSRAVGLLGDLAKFFGDLPGPVQTAVVAMAGIAIVAGPIRNVISTFTSLKTAIQKVGPAVTATGGVIAAAAGIYLLYRQRKADAEQTTRDFTEALKAEQRGQEGASAAAIAAKLSNDRVVSTAEALKITTRDLARFIRGEQVPAVKDAIDAYNSMDAALDISDSTGVATDDIVHLGSVLVESRDAFAQAEREVAAFNTVQDELGVKTTDAADKAAAATGSWTGFHGAVFDSGTAVEDTGRKMERANEAMERSGEIAKTLADRQLARLTEEAEDAEDAAKGLVDALDEVFGTATDLQGAADELAANFDDLEASIKDNGKTLDSNTEKGRANREQVRENVRGIQDYIKKLAESGATSDRVSGEYAGLRQQLIDQVTPFFNSEQAAADYIDQLGLTPDRVDTAVSLTNVDNAKRLIQEHIDRFGAIPDSKLSTILVAANRGDIDAVEQQLRDLARDRVAHVRIQSTGGATGGGGVSGRQRAAAEGAFIRGGTAAGVRWSLAEKPGSRGDEVVLPLGNLPRMRDLLTNPEVGPRVAAALDGGGGSVAVAAMPVSTGVTVHGGIHVGSRDDISAVRNELDLLAWRMRVGAN